MKKSFETTFSGRNFSVDVFPLDKKKAIESGAVTEKFTEEFPYVIQIYLAETNKLIDTQFLSNTEFENINIDKICAMLNDVDQNSFIPLVHPDEPTEDTVKWHDANWVEDGFNEKKILLSDCKIYQRGNYIIIEVPGGKVAYREHIGNYCYILDAIEYMKPEVLAEWKTLQRLTTFRQAIRECTAQGMGIEDLYQIDKGINFEEYNEFIKVARVYDKRHHGSLTF